jgi:ABC-type multidrug transport system ATPase subunit
VVAIEARGLTRRYGPALAIDHVSFTVRSGEVFGFLAGLFHHRRRRSAV